MDWDGLRALVEVLGHNTEGFDRFASTIGQLSGYISFFDDRARSRKEYSKIRIDMNDLLRMLSDYVQGIIPHAKLRSNIEDLARRIDKENELLTEIQGEVWTELDEKGVEGRMSLVLRQYRVIQVLLGRFMLNETSMIWKTANEEAPGVVLDCLPHSPSGWYRSPSDDSGHRSGCEPNTRVEVLDEIRYWIRHNVDQRLYWLNGMAGTGKTTIAYSVCEHLESSGHPMASFFCDRRLPECRDVRLIVPSISYQLCSLSDPFRSTIVMNEGAEVRNWSISKQFERLVATPLQKTGHTLSANPVIVIDGLEECDDRGGVDEILRILVANVPELPIKVLVTGRPMLNVDTFMRELRSSWDLAELRLHELLLPTVQRDIIVYLQSRLESISPSAEDLEGLANQSGGLFNHATFYVRYLLSTDPSKSVERIQQLLGSPSARYSDGRTDFLYTAMLETASDEYTLFKEQDSADAMLVLHTVVCASEAFTASMLVGLPGLRSASSIGPILEILGMILQIVGTSGKLAVRHQSFLDYICDPALSGKFYCNPDQHAARLAQVCFSLIKAPTPAYNICNLASSYLEDRDVPDIEEKVKDAIPDQLLHACRNLGTYITLIDDSNRQLVILHEFLSTRLLLWMEVLNLKQCMHDGAEQLQKIELWLKASNSNRKNKYTDTILPLLEDAQSFVAAFMLSPLSDYTPHIYVSALPLWPNDRPISQHYVPTMEGLGKLRGTSVQQETRGLCFTGFPIRCVACSPNSEYIAISAHDSIWILDTRTQQLVGQTLTGHTNSVWSVAYSPDSAYIVSGSEDHTIRIWDARTGRLVGKPLEGHTSPVYSVAYSPNGACIASGSWDHTIRIWDAHTGQPIGKPLRGHISSVRTVAYSPDGIYIASGSSDDTIRIWNAHTGQPVGKPLRGHRSPVYSVAYSPDGAYIASGSSDYTIRIWDARTGQPVGKPLTEGHISTVYSVTYSPDGAYIASGSEDHTICIWDVRTGQLIGEPLEGHTSSINSVAYLPDGAYIVSGSSDDTIRIWDARIGKPIGKSLQGHTDWVYSAAYSPDSAHITSGSRDHTVSIWDARTGQPIGNPLEGHTNSVRSVAYSPDGAYIVSGSSDNTVRIWDTHTGQPVGKPLNIHTAAVNSVAYSPDGAYIASGSWDKSIRIWDAHTGQPIGKPLSGHADSVESVSYSPDGAHLASGSRDHTVHIWDARTGRLIGRPLKGHTNYVNSVAYSPDGAYIVSGSFDCTIRIWDAHTGQPVGKSLEGHIDLVWSVAYSPDGAYIASGSSDRTIRIWDARTGQAVGKPLQGHTSLVCSVAYSPDGVYIVSGSSDRTICTWNGLIQHPISPRLQSSKSPTNSGGYTQLSFYPNVYNTSLASKISNSSSALKQPTVDQTSRYGMRAQLFQIAHVLLALPSLFQFS
ncbi:hypothetical protein FRC12_002700 [Ceratobasidium sp. 428]|nr:hypothetical protein FRC12_002700 [Ceratobasidium sp. 428]